MSFDQEHLNNLLSDFTTYKKMYINELCSHLISKNDLNIPEENENSKQLKYLINSIKKIINNKNTSNPVKLYTELLENDENNLSLQDIQHIVYNLSNEEHLNAIEEIKNKNNTKIYQEKTNKLLNQHAEELSEAKKGYKKLQEENKNLKSHINAIENEVKFSQEINVSLNSEINEIKNIKKELQIKLESLQNKYDAISSEKKQEYENQSNKIISLQNEIKILSDQISTVLLEKNILKEKEHSNNKINQDLSNKLESLQNHHDITKKELEDKIYSLRDELKLISDEKESIVIKYNNLNSSIEEKDKTILDLSNKLESVENHFKIESYNLEKKIKSMNYEMDELNKDKEKMQKFLNEALSAQKNAEQAKLDLENKYDFELNHMKNTEEDLSKKLLDLKKELGEKDIEILDTKQRLQKSGTVTKETSQNAVDLQNEAELTINELNLKIKNLEQKSKLYEEELELEKNARIKEKTEFTEKYNLFNTQKEILSDTKNKLEALENSSTIQNTDREKTIKILELEIDELKTNSVKIQTELNKHLQDNKGLNILCKELKNNYELLENTNKEQNTIHQKKIDDLHFEIEENQKTINQLLEKNNFLHSEEKKLKQTIDDSKNHNEMMLNDLNLKLENNNKIIETLHLEINDFQETKLKYEAIHQDDLKKIKDLSNALNHTKNILEGKTNEFQIKLSDSIKNNKILKKEISDYKDALQIYKEKLSITNKKLNEIQENKEKEDNKNDGELNKLKHAVIEYNKQLKTITEEAREHQESRMELQKQLNKAGLKIKELQVYAEEEQNKLKSKMQKIELENEKLLSEIKSLKQQ